MACRLSAVGCVVQGYAKSVAERVSVQPAASERWRVRLHDQRFPTFPCRFAACRWLMRAGIVAVMTAGSLSPAEEKASSFRGWSWRSRPKTAQVLLAAKDKDKKEAGSASLAGVDDKPAPPPQEAAAQETKPYLPDVKDTAIFAGKKTSVANLQTVPPVINNNYRQAFAELPGLLVSEMIIPSHVNITYRGLGDPHESTYMLLLKDGVPISNSLFGDPNVYYNPPLESVQRVELIRGGSALLYGPQPGPVVNYATSVPPQDKKLAFTTVHTGGSDGLYSTFSELAGT
ncbi:MAG: hypothetical protein FJ388_25345, partial [Verrucomicrobia bacterium]|nr:hypothetical protein [Verrucomicrobiota bacterium]